MAVLDTIGSTSAIAQGTRKRWQPGGGEVTILVWEGERTAVEAKYEELKALASTQPIYNSIEFDPGRGKATLTAEVADPVSVVGSEQQADGTLVQYELMANEVSRPIEQYFTDLGADEINEVFASVERREGDPGFTGDRLLLFKFLSGGVEEYYDQQYVLRETKTVSGKTAISASFAGVGEVVSPPNASAVNKLLSGLPAQEWLKRAPQVRRISKTKWEIVTEWWGAAAWSHELYGGTAHP